VYEREVLYLTGEPADIQTAEAAQRMPEDPMRVNVARWIRENVTTEEVTAEQILEYIGIPAKSITRSDQSRVAQSLIELGWEKHLRRDEEHKIFYSVYTRPLRDRMDILMGAI
jgi:hypothetical protein